MGLDLYYILRFQLKQECLVEGYYNLESDPKECRE